MQWKKGLAKLARPAPGAAAQPVSVIKAPGVGPLLCEAGRVIEVTAMMQRFVIGKKSCAPQTRRRVHDDVKGSSCCCCS